MLLAADHDFPMKNQLSIGQYLIQRLDALGVRHVFGIPGDYVLGLLRSAREKQTADHQHLRRAGRGFAADAYARVRGLGVVCVTYCVGGLKVANTTAEAFAEKSPVVVISGAPGHEEREKNPLLHHKVREFDTQKKVFEQLTVASTVLERSADRLSGNRPRARMPRCATSGRSISNCRATWSHVPGIPHHKPPEIHEAKRSAHRCEAALAEAVAMINARKQPVILADVEVHRFGLQEELSELPRKPTFPVAATILGKSVIGEHHPFYLGVYEGAMGREDVRRYVESSDCVIMLGAFMTDINLGIFTARLDPARSISCDERETLHSLSQLRRRSASKISCAGCCAAVETARR